MLKKLEDAWASFQNDMKSSLNKADILNLKADYLGKKGKVSEILKSLKDATAEQRKEIGARSNEIKEGILGLVQTALEKLELDEINEKLQSNWIDVTFRESISETGLKKAALHPVTSIRQEIEDIFLSMGFEVLDGPFIEDEFHNFEALNIPADHPARDMQDTFWFQDKKTPT